MKNGNEKLLNLLVESINTNFPNLQRGFHEIYYLVPAIKKQ